jgi:hypothetical protein
MKVSELKGPQLDYWVARAEGRHPSELRTDEGCLVIRLNNDQLGYAYCPSENWADGGPIIEWEGLQIAPYKGLDTWIAGKADVNDPCADWHSYNHEQTGTTPLEAAMRCIVASKFGDEVEDI